MKHMPEALWLKGDRDVFGKAFTRPEDPFDETGAGAHLKPRTVAQLKHNYRRWLGVLRDTEPEALALPPANRITPERIGRFCQALSATCNGVTVATAIGKLYMVARYIAPERDWVWLRSIVRRLEALGKPKPRSAIPFTSARLAQIGIDLMDEADVQAEHEMHCQGRPKLITARLYRDGFLIALSALLPLRRTNMSELQLDHSLLKVGGTWQICVAGAFSKNGDDIDAVLPEWLALRLERYLERYRPLFPASDGHGAVFASNKSRPMTACGIAAAFQNRIRDRTGVTLSIHNARRIAATTLAIADPENVSVGSDLLGHRSNKVTEAHYHLANGVEASRMIAEIVSKRRSSLS
jgi:integrase